MKVFMSYVERDRDLATDLARELESNGYRVFLTDRDILPGDNWAEVLGRALDQSEALVVLVSPESIASPWVRREIDFALGSPRYKHRLIPIELRRTESMPWILEKLPLIRAAPGKKGRAALRRDLLETLNASRN